MFSLPIVLRQSLKIHCCLRRFRDSIIFQYRLFTCIGCSSNLTPLIHRAFASAKRVQLKLITASIPTASLGIRGTANRVAKAAAISVTIFVGLTECKDSVLEQGSEGWC